MSFDGGKIVRLWGAVDYEPKIDFFDRMYKAAHDLREHFPHWWTDKIQVMLYDDEKHESLNITSKRIGFESANPSDVNTKAIQLGGYVRDTLETLRFKELRRMGVKITTYVDLGLSFDEIRSQLRPLCLPVNVRLEKITSPDIADLALHFDYKWKGKTAMLRVGPMNNEQGRTNLNNIGNIDKIFISTLEKNDLRNFYNSIPESFLYFDLDVYQEADFKADQWLNYITECVQHITDVFDGFKAIILESK